MNITKIKWKNHPVLGNLKLDFINPVTNNPYNTILFAGENGTGKTTILETISTFLNNGSFKAFEFIEYKVDGQVLKAIPLQGTNDESIYNMVEANGNMATIYPESYQVGSPNPQDIRYGGCVFSKARADFKTEQISYATTKKLDENKYDVDQEDNFTSLKQLIVDIENQDNAEYAEINRNSSTNPKSWDDFYITSKVYRFRNAFNNFFEKLKYDKVADVNNEKTILFNKNNKSISIDRLSTGEKQIVFRGAYLLKNNKKLKGAAVMIDEPELSMHPKWQEKILQYYKNLFTESGTQNVQLFFATHSEHVLKEALSNRNDNLVIVLHENNGIISAKRIDTPAVLPSITFAETNYLAFDVISNDYHIELYGWLQQKQSKFKVKECDTYIKSQNEYIANTALYSKLSTYRNTNYETLPTYVRNAIDHPDPAHRFTEQELRNSIELLIKLCR